MAKEQKNPFEEGAHSLIFDQKNTLKKRLDVYDDDPLRPFKYPDTHMTHMSEFVPIDDSILAGMTATRHMVSNTGIIVTVYEPRDAKYINNPNQHIVVRTIDKGLVSYHAASITLPSQVTSSGRSSMMVHENSLIVVRPSGSAMIALCLDLQTFETRSLHIHTDEGRKVFLIHVFYKDQRIHVRSFGKQILHHVIDFDKGVILVSIHHTGFNLGAERLFVTDLGEYVFCYPLSGNMGIRIIVWDNTNDVIDKMVIPGRMQASSSQERRHDVSVLIDRKNDKNYRLLRKNGRWFKLPLTSLDFISKDIKVHYNEGFIEVSNTNHLIDITTGQAYKYGPDTGEELNTINIVDHPEIGERIFLTMSTVDDDFRTIQAYPLDDVNGFEYVNAYLK